MNKYTLMIIQRAENSTEDTKKSKGGEGKQK